MKDTIHIVEPSLTNQTGHCYSFISNFLRSSEAYPVFLWANRRADITFAEKNVRIRKYFISKIRRFQSFFLYKKLLNSPGKIFISTATYTDFVLMNWAAREAIAQSKVYFYVHWINATLKKRTFLKKLAQKQPNFVILGPTPSVIDIFRESGFENAHIVPYPISGLICNAQAGHARFTGVLYAGAARQDKGISHVVNLVEHLSKLKLEIPVKMQISPDHRGKYDAATSTDIDRLDSIAYPALLLFPETLDAEEYANLFAGSICIQLYNAQDFADRVSGVALDALSAGCPIVTTAGTWIARMVQRFDAGLVVDDTTPNKVLLAVQAIIADYSRYNEKAYKAGQVLQQENSADILFKSVAG